MNKPGTKEATMQRVSSALSLTCLCRTATRCIQACDSWNSGADSEDSSTVSCVQLIAEATGNVCQCLSHASMASAPQRSKRPSGTCGGRNHKLKRLRRDHLPNCSLPQLGPSSEALCFSSLLKLHITQSNVLTPPSATPRQLLFLG